MASRTGPTQPARSGLEAVYAQILDTSSNANSKSSPTSISRSPVVSKPVGGEQQQQDQPAADDPSAQKLQVNSALRFQPTKRPQLPTQKAKARPAFPKASLPTGTAGASNAASSATGPGAASGQPLVKTTIADWTGDDDDVNGFYGADNRPRGGRKKRKKNKEEQLAPQDWDDVYDPARPNSYGEYKHSDEKIREIREWKDRLYAHRMARRYSSDLDSDLDSDDGRHSKQAGHRQYAPPRAYSFAPPPSGDDEEQDTMDLSSPPPLPPPPPPRTADVPNDPTGKDAYNRRVRLSQGQHMLDPSPQAFDGQYISPPPPPPPPPHPVFPPPGGQPPLPPAVPASSVITPAAGIISRAPVRYSLPPAPPDVPPSEMLSGAALQEALPSGELPDAEPEPRSLRPGQKGFAERLMSKYGWTKGQGLGATNSGIINPLRVQVEKQPKKKSGGADGGGWLGDGATAPRTTGSSSRGKIIGGKKRKGDNDEEGQFGRMSEVVVLRGMVDGLDLDAEMHSTGDNGGSGGGLMQEIGEECSEKYGRVERVFIHRLDNDDDLESSKEGEGPRVFIKFTSQLSALRAVNDLQGRIFNGNSIMARFFDADKFEAGSYF